MSYLLPGIVEGPIDVMGGKRWGGVFQGMVEICVS